jgi:hypothetical protein
LGHRHEPPNAGATDGKLSSSPLSKLFFITATKKRKNRNKGEGRKHSQIATIAEAPNWRILVAVFRAEEAQRHLHEGHDARGANDVIPRREGFSPASSLT